MKEKLALHITLNTHSTLSNIVVALSCRWDAFHLHEQESESAKGMEELKFRENKENPLEASRDLTQGQSFYFHQDNDFKAKIAC